MKKITALLLVTDELERILEEHDTRESCHAGYAFILEELDELWDEIKKDQGATHRGASEAVQVAACAIRYLMDLCEEETAGEHNNKVANHEEKKLTYDKPYRIPLSDTERWGGGYSG